MGACISNMSKPYLQGQGIATLSCWQVFTFACECPCNVTVAAVVGCANYRGTPHNKNDVAY